MCTHTVIIGLSQPLSMPAIMLPRIATLWENRENRDTSPILMNPNPVNVVLGEFRVQQMIVDTAQVILDLRFWIAETADSLRLTATCQLRECRVLFTVDDGTGTPVWKKCGGSGCPGPTACR